MSVSVYFGLPGCGKTTLAVKHIYQYVKKGLKVYTNIDVKINGVIHVEKSDLGAYDLHDGVMILDEITLWYDNRDFKEFKTKDKVFFLKHRHANLRIELFTQKYNAIDVKIQNITESVYWIKKCKILRWRSYAVHVPYGVYIPDRDDCAHVGEIINGYYKPTRFFARLFAERMNRWKYYKYFDSFERDSLPPLPSGRVITGGFDVAKRRKSSPIPLTTDSGGEPPEEQQNSTSEG